MKKILFIINSLTIGGSEKSLVSLLNLIDYSNYEVDLLMLKKGEDFDKYIPKSVNVLAIPDYYRYLNGELKLNSLKKFLKYNISRYKSSIQLRINNLKNNPMNNQQIFYLNQVGLLESLEKKYDVAIAYAQGFPTYFLADKVNAQVKLAWINCDYTATSYNKKLDKKFYDKIDKIIAVSESCKKSIINVNSEYEKKINIIRDIVNPDLILKFSEEKINEFDNSSIKILTVARLVQDYKGYDIAIEAARLLRDSGYNNFKWYAIGEGPDRKELEKLIRKYNLEDIFILLGSKDNPYPYMRKCDIYVQTSRKEGFGLAAIEAKILKKAIICTEFETAKEIISNNIDGIITGMESLKVYESIKKYIEDVNLKNKIEKNLKNLETYNSLDEINKLYKLIEV